MSDFVVQLALSNLVVSSVLAMIAYAVHRRARYPFLAHLLWVVVLLKLVTPPVLSLPVAHVPTAIGLPALAPIGDGTAASLTLGDGLAIDVLVAGLLTAWAVGSLMVLAVSLLRIHRFDRLLRKTSREAPGWIQYVAQGTALRLGMEEAPRVDLTTARLSPMTWWIGGEVRVLLPHGLSQDIDSDQLSWVLGHELGHVKRRDHLVRWLEWIACVSFWWNPVAWWARRHLRLDEEAACDALVLDRLGPRPRTYAQALLAVVEHLARPTLQPPAVATGIDGGVSLERRFRLIVAGPGGTQAPRWLAIGLLGGVVALLPLGLGLAGEREAVTAPIVSSAVVSDSERAFLAGVVPGTDRQSRMIRRADDGPTMAKLSASIGATAAVRPTGANARTSRAAVSRVGGNAPAKRARISRQPQRDRGARSPGTQPPPVAGRTSRL